MRRDALRLSAALAPPALALALGACSWDVGKLFDREDPRVEQARHDLEASTAGQDADLAAARADLEDVLAFRCEADGGRDLVVERPGASVDLGLVIFRVAELIGQRFGDEEHDAGSSGEQIAAARAQALDCAHLLLARVAKDPTTPAPLALRARYLLGNFSFLARRYRDAIDDYDLVLLQHPARGTTAPEAGPADDEDAIARDAAWNRALALQRLEDEDKKDAGPDAPDGQDSQGAPDSRDAGDAADGSDAPDSSDGGDAADSGGGRDGGGDAGHDGGGQDGSRGQDSGSDGGDEAGRPPPAPSASASATPKPIPSSQVDLRELDRFDKKVPLDLDLPQRRRTLPRSLDK